MSSPISPTPVLDALERVASISKFDTLYGGMFRRLLAEASSVPIVSMDPDHFAYGDSAHSFPDPDVKLHDQPLWVEVWTGLVGGLTRTSEGASSGVATGILFTPYQLGADGRDDPWCKPLLNARFCVAVDGMPFVFPMRVIIEPGLHGMFDTEAGKMHRESPEWFGLADHERVRHGLQAAVTAPPEQLLRMTCEIVELDGRYHRAIPTEEVPSVGVRLPRYAAAREDGVEGLRWALMSTCVEDWNPAGAVDLVNVLGPAWSLTSNVRTLGPMIALQVLAEIAQARNADRHYARLEPLAPPYGRGRKAYSFIPTPQNLTAKKS